MSIISCVATLTQLEKTMMFVSHFCWLNSRGRLLAVLLAVVAMPVSASAQTTSDLFEKAVYADETAGDLDKAIKFYRQVLAKAKGTNSLAAEAQYRLGLCFEKQKKTKLAHEAFQAVVGDFPKEAKFVAMAKKRLPGALKLLPVPWQDGEQLHLTMTMANGMEIGKYVASIDATKLNGKQVWRCSNRIFTTLNGSSSFSESFCDKKTFAPLQSHWIHSRLGSADAKYNESNVTIDIAGRDKPMELDFTDPAYDNEQGFQLFRRLPLEVGMHNELTVVATLTGNIVPLEFDVPKKETITTAAGTFDCYRMELEIGQTFWISDDANRYIVRFGAGITADLTRVEQRKQDESLELEDDQFSITLPGGWFAYEQESEGSKRIIHLLDRRAIATITLSIEDKDSLKEEEQVSAQAWAESIVKTKSKHLKNSSVRDEGIINFKIGEHDAASVVFDYEQGKKAMTGYGVAVIGDRSAIGLLLRVPSDQYEAARVEFDAVVRSLLVK